MDQNIFCEILEKMQSYDEKIANEAVDKFIDNGYSVCDVDTKITSVDNPYFTSRLLYICNMTKSYLMGWKLFKEALEKNYTYDMKNLEQTLIVISAKKYLCVQEGLNEFVAHMSAVEKETRKIRYWEIKKINDEVGDVFDYFENAKFKEIFKIRIEFEIFTGVKKTSNHNEYKRLLTEEEILLFSRCSNKIFLRNTLSKNFYFHILKSAFLEKIIDLFGDCEDVLKVFDSETLVDISGLDSRFKDNFFEKISIKNVDCSLQDSHKYLEKIKMVIKDITLKNDCISANAYEQVITPLINEYEKTSVGSKYYPCTYFIKRTIKDNVNTDFTMKVIDDAIRVFSGEVDKEEVLNFATYYWYEQEICEYKIGNSFSVICCYTFKDDLEFFKNYFNVKKQELIENLPANKGYLKEILEVLIYKGSVEDLEIYTSIFFESNEYDHLTIVNLLYRNIFKDKNVEFYERYFLKYIDIDILGTRNEQQFMTALSLLIHVKSKRAIETFFMMLDNSAYNEKYTDFFKFELIKMILKIDFFIKRDKIRLDLGHRWEIICREIAHINFGTHDLEFNPHIENDKIPDIVVKTREEYQQVPLIIECKLSTYFKDGFRSATTGKHNILREVSKYFNYCEMIEYWILCDTEDLSYINIEKTEFLFWDDIKSRYELTESIINEAEYIISIRNLILGGKGHLQEMGLLELRDRYCRCKDIDYIFTRNFEKKASVPILKDKEIYVVRQFDLHGKFLEEYESTAVAGKAVGSATDSISNAVAGRQDSARGYLWRKFLKDSERADIEVKQKLDFTGMNILQIGKNGEVLKEYSTIIDAAKSIGIDRKGISDVLRGRQKTAGGFFWEAQ